MEDKIKEAFKKIVLEIVDMTLESIFEKTKFGGGCKDHGSNIDILQKDLYGLLKEHYLTTYKKKLLEELLEWIYANHEHHAYAKCSEGRVDKNGKLVFKEKGLPKGIQPCADNDSPYVNSLKLEKFIKSIINNTK